MSTITGNKTALAFSPSSLHPRVKILPSAFMTRGLPEGHINKDLRLGYQQFKLNENEDPDTGRERREDVFHLPEYENRHIFKNSSAKEPTDHHYTVLELRNSDHSLVRYLIGALA